mmetsp:Transcript_97484/g.176079  ORF Transcript_97484/g.176079 Transcript_97484/m.176079 type:complete len:559 (-) Transcript_97484:176-1852(-)
MTSRDIEAFAAHWQLNEGSVEVLYSLGPEGQRRALESFAPKETTQNVDGLFRGFARSIQSSELCTSYVQEQGLDEGCHDALMQLDTNTREVVMGSFQPKPGTKSVSNLFMGFCRSIKEGGKGKGKPGGKGSSKGPPPAQEKGHGHNWGGYVPAGPRESRGPPPGLPQGVAGFLQTWGLDDMSASALSRHPPDVQQHVLDNFSPKPGTRNVNGLFMGFLKSLHSVMEQAPQQTQRHYQEEHPSAQLHADVDAFLRHWGLDESSAGNLWSQSPAIQQHVLGHFSPKPGTRNVNGLFMSFLKSMASILPASRPPAQEERQYRRPQAEAPREAATQWVGASQLQEDVTRFALNFELDEESVQELLQKSPEVIGRVLQNFSPKPGTRNVRGLLFSFMRSMEHVGEPAAKGGGGKGSWAPQADSKGSYGPERRKGGAAAHASAAAHTSAPYSTAPSAGRANDSWTSGGKGGAKGGASAWLSAGSRTAQQSVSEQAVHDFASHWGLDEECVAALSGQPADIQQDMLERFQPREGTRDVKHLFMGFLRSKVQGGAPGGKGKSKGKW